MPAKRARSADAVAPATAESAEKSAKKGAKTETAAAVGAGGNNDAVCKVFEQLLVYESKDGNKWAGVAYNKVLTVLRGLKKPLMCGKDVAHLDGVGKASVEKIDEFLSTGKLKKLDELKAIYGDMPTNMIIATKSAPGGAKAKAVAAAAGAKPPTKAQLLEIKKVQEQLESLTLPQLKELCKLNKQVQTGTKSDLIERCSQGKVLGQIPMCTFCGAGKLRYDIKTGMYKCPGYTDDDKYMPCVFSSGQVDRLPWVDLP